MRKLSNADLIKKYMELLDAPVTADNIILLKEAYDEIKTRKDIRLQKAENPRIEFLEGRKKWSEIHVVPAVSGCEVGLVVLDKESVPGLPFKKYSFGYALDSTKTFEGENILKVLDAIIEDNLKVDSVVAVKVKSVTPFKNGRGMYEVKLTDPLVFTQVKEKLNSSKEIIRKAFACGCIEMDKTLALDLCKTGILAFDVDRHFGVNLDKTHPIKKASGFMENGIVYCVVYPVNEKDTDGDYATREEVQKACWKFARDYNQYNFMHADSLTDRDVSLVENACALADVPEFGIRKGDWYQAIQVHKLELRKRIETGEITGLSMEGSAKPGEPIKELS